MTTRAISLAAVVVALAAGCAPQARVVKVVDGDTVDLEWHGIAVRSRIAGFDAPEPAEPRGFEARDALARMIAGRRVGVRWAGRDRYCRQLVYLTVDGRDVTDEMRGMGFDKQLERRE